MVHCLGETQEERSLPCTAMANLAKCREEARGVEEGEKEEERGVEEGEKEEAEVR